MYMLILVMMMMMMMMSSSRVVGTEKLCLSPYFFFLKFEYAKRRPLRTGFRLREEPTSTEDESLVVEPVWNAGNEQTDSASRTSLEEFRKIANEESNENSKSEMLKLLDFYDQVSSREDALKKKLEEFHDKRNNVLQKMESLHRTVRTDRETERAGLQISMK